MSETNGEVKTTPEQIEKTWQEVSQKAEEVAKMASENIQEVQRQFTRRANDAKKEVVKQLHNAAEAIRKEVRENKAGDEAIKSADNLAKGLEKAANYLNSRSLDQMGEEATRVVRNNPLRTLALVFIVGIIVGLILRRD